MSSAAHHKGAASGAEIEGWLSRIENISGVVSKYLTEDPDVEADEREQRRIKVEKDENEAFQLKMKDRYDPARYKRFENEEFIEKLIKEVDAPPVVKTTDLRLLSDFEKIAVKEAEACKARGNAALVGGNLEEARNQYEMGIGMDPQSIDLVIALNNNLAQVALRQLNYEDCVRRATVVLAIERLNVKALFRRASAYSSLYKLREAKTDVDLLLSADSKNNEAKKLRTEVDDDLVDLEMFANVDGGTSQLQLLVKDLQAQMLLEEQTEEAALKIAEHLVFADRAVESIAGALTFHTSGGVQLCIQLLYSTFKREEEEGSSGSVASKGLAVLVLRVLSKCLPTKGSSRRTLQLMQRREEENATTTTPTTNLQQLLTYLVGVVNAGTLPVGIPAGRLLGAVLEGGHKVGMVLDVLHSNHHQLQMGPLASHIDAVSKKGGSATEWEICFADSLLVVIRALLRRDPASIPESTLQKVIIPFCRSKVNSTSTTGLADVLEMLLAVPRGGYPSMESHKDILVGLHKKLFKRGGSSITTTSGGLLVEGCASITYNALVQYPVVAAVEGASSTRAELVDFLVKAGVFNDYLTYIKKHPNTSDNNNNNNNMASIARVVGVVAKGITVSEPLCQIVQGEDVISVVGWGMLATPALLEHATSILCHVYWRAKLRNVEVDAATHLITKPLLQQLFNVCCTIKPVSPAEVVSIANASLLLGNFPLHLKVGGTAGGVTVESWLKSIGGMKTTIEALREVRNHAEQAERSKNPALGAQLRSAQKNVASLIGKWASGSEDLKEALRVSNGFEVLMCSLKETKTVA